MVRTRKTQTDPQNDYEKETLPPENTSGLTTTSSNSYDSKISAFDYILRTHFNQLKKLQDDFGNLSEKYKEQDKEIAVLKANFNTVNTHAKWGIGILITVIIGMFGYYLAELAPTIADIKAEKKAEKMMESKINELKAEFKENNTQSNQKQKNKN